APPCHDRHRTCHVSERPDIRRERALAHLRQLAGDSLAQVVDEARLGGAVPLELGDQFGNVLDSSLKLQDLVDAALLLRGQLRSHRRLTSVMRSLRSARAHRAARRGKDRAAGRASVRYPRWPRAPDTPRDAARPQRMSGTCASMSLGWPWAAIGGRLAYTQMQYGLSVATSSTPASSGTWCTQRRTTATVV